MPRKLSAGILVYRLDGNAKVEVLIAHMGGPFWAKKDMGGWSIPKGEYLEGEDPLAVARREFREELGSVAPDDKMLSLGSAKQPSGKMITVWAVEGDFDISTVVSNTFKMEWPQDSGIVQEFPEIDRADWFTPIEAKTRLVRGQVRFIDRLLEILLNSSAIGDSVNKEDYLEVPCQHLSDPRLRRSRDL